MNRLAFSNEGEKVMEISFIKRTVIIPGSMPTSAFYHADTCLFKRR